MTARPAMLASVLALVALAAGCEAGSGGDDRQARTVTVQIGESVRSGDRGSDAPPSAGEGRPPQVPGAESCDGAREPTTEENLRRAEIAIRCLTNAARRENGLAELAFDERLARAAATRSDAMAEADFFGHRGPGDSSVRNAVRRTGWIPQGRSWLLGENIGWAPQGGAIPAQLMRSWLDSTTHRANILAAHYTETGVGAVAAVPQEGAEPGATFTQIFGVTGEAARAAQTG